jgi:hypothetical protein
MNLNGLNSKNSMHIAYNFNEHFQQINQQEIMLRNDNHHESLIKIKKISRA